MKPDVFKKAKDAIKHGRHLVAIDKKLSNNGDGFMVARDGYLLGPEGYLCYVSVSANGKKLELQDAEKV